MGNSLNSIVFQPPNPPSTVNDYDMVLSGPAYIPVVTYACKSPKVLVFFSHGNAEDLGQVQRDIHQLFMQLQAKVSCAVAAYDYAGYGISRSVVARIAPPPSSSTDVSPSELNAYRNAEDALAHAMKMANVKHDAVVLWGRSLGSGPTCYLAQKAIEKKTPFKAVVLQSPLLSAYRVGLRSTWNWTLPGDVFNNHKRAAQTLGFAPSKIFVIHGELDEVVPFSHGVILNSMVADEYRYPPLFVRGAGHNDVAYRVTNHANGGRSLEDHIACFVASVI